MSQRCVSILLGMHDNRQGLSVDPPYWWGELQSARRYSDDVWEVSTGQRGGLYVGVQSAQLVPMEVRRCVRSRRWIDGDIDFPLYMVFLFEHLYPEAQQLLTDRGVTRRRMLERALNTATHYDEYAGCRTILEHLHKQLTV